MKAMPLAAGWLICLGASAALSLPVVRGYCGALPVADLAAGWIVAGLNGLAALWLNRRAVGTDGRRFVQWGVIANALRLAALVAILGAYWWRFPERIAAFALTVLTGALVFMAGEVALLHVENIRPRIGGKAGRPSA